MGGEVILGQPVSLPVNMPVVTVSRLPSDWVSLVTGAVVMAGVVVADVSERDTELKELSPFLPLLFRPLGVSYSIWEASSTPVGRPGPRKTLVTGEQGIPRGPMTSLTRHVPAHWGLRNPAFPNCPKPPNDINQCVPSSAPGTARYMFTNPPLRVRLSPE